MISEKEYKKRRDTLAKKLKSDSIGVVFSAPTKTRSNDTEYPYRQDSNFYYLTGFKEENSALVFVKTKESIKSFLFVAKKDKGVELWLGERLGKIEAQKRFLVDKVYHIEDFSVKVKKTIGLKRYFFYDFNANNELLKECLKQTKKYKALQNISLHIEKQRVIKSVAEIKLIKKAIEISAKAHHIAMQSSKVAKMEYQLQSEIEYIFKSSGAYSDAYTSIVAGGNGANTLHYIKNNQVLKDGELILIDAGCEYEYYASDITRTIPVNGKFSPAQKELYNLVLTTQLKIIQMIKPKVKRGELQTQAEILLTKGMVNLGILKGDYKKLIKKQKHKKYYPHGIGHWMGLDVHDMAPYLDKHNEELPLKSGMVLTIEPGLYIDENDKSVPSEYRGIGIRIEDDILVTDSGYENLSKNIVKSIQDIESKVIPSIV